MHNANNLMWTVDKSQTTTWSGIKGMLSITTQIIIIIGMYYIAPFE